MATSSAPQAQGEWTFKICEGCSNPMRHAYFHDGDGDPVSDPFFSTNSAIEVMMSSLKRGIIPVENEETLTTQIRSSGLLEKLKDESRVVKSTPISFGEMLNVLGMVMTIEEEMKSPFTFVVEDKEKRPVAHFVSVTGIRTIPIASKTKAADFINMMVKMDLMGFDEASNLLMEIDASRLPEE